MRGVVRRDRRRVAIRHCHQGTRTDNGKYTFRLAVVLHGFTLLWYVLTMSRSDPSEFQASFFRSQPLAESMIGLFDALPETYFYIKDRDSRFVTVNHLFLENHGLAAESEAIGKTDRDFHPPLMAEAYIAEDRRVMDGEVTVPGQVWLVFSRRSSPRWYVSTKTPLFNRGGDVVGLAGAMYRIERPEEMETYFQELLPTVRYLESHFAETVSMVQMARLSGLSATHFNRRFRQLLRMTPTEYLQVCRTQAARSLLATTSRSLADIAAAVGYADQSHFTKRFRASTGMTPDAYRRRFRT
jgi:AraC-like DNA-binding protein